MYNHTTSIFSMGATVQTIFDNIARY